MSRLIDSLTVSPSPDGNIGSIDEETASAKSILLSAEVDTNQILKVLALRLSLYPIVQILSRIG